jgi:hypothetical protein
MDTKMTPNANPLRQFFRQPAIYIRLPSNGKFWEEGALNMPEGHELPVYPMTAIDEITYRTPDALFNGEAVVSVIQSCIPNITNAWKMPSVDVDTVLVAIRIASYGHALDLGSTCPACGHDHDISLDLRVVMERLRSADYNKNISSNGLEIHFQPLTYRQLTENSLRQFEQQKVMNVLPDTEMPEEEKIRRLQAAIKQLTELTVVTLADCISMIKTDSAMVTEKSHIAEFLRNCDGRIFSQIREHITALREQADIKPISLECPECKHQYQQPFSLDQSNFFVGAS